MRSALSFALLRPVGFVNFHGAGRGKACFLRAGAAYFSTGWGGATIPALWDFFVIVLDLSNF